MRKPLKLQPLPGTVALQQALELEVDVARVLEAEELKKRGAARGAQAQKLFLPGKGKT